MKVLTDPEKSLASKPATKQITIRHIVTHTAGLAYVSNAPAPLKKFYEDLGINPSPSAFGDPRVPNNLSAFAEVTAFAPVLFEPGSQWHYSIGLDIAGAVIEKVSGIAFEDFLAQRIFAPLGMVDTSFTVPASKIDRLTTLYQGDGKGGLAVVDPGKTSNWAKKPAIPSGGGGLVSSARDYSKFMAMLLGEGQAGKARIMKTETAKLMMSNIMEPGVVAKTASGETGYGAGGRSVVTATSGGEQVGTYGWSGAANSHAFVDRKTGVYAVLMTQRLMWADSKLLPDLDTALYGDLA
jgi:CubicO group peptidase (beta-lactamase class C family)